MGTPGKDQGFHWFYSTICILSLIMMCYKRKYYHRTNCLLQKGTTTEVQKAIAAK